MAATRFAMRGAVAVIKICKPPVNSLGFAVRKGISDGLDMVERVGHPRFQIHYDTHHAHIEEGDPGAAIRAGADKIGHVHISENDRGVPGRGQVAWQASFEALKEIDYDGWMVIEAFSRRDPDFANAIHVWRDYAPADEIWREGLEFIKRSWAAS